jgi:predicted enzyme involved in methoxymalonyl-ACP biosynthesis
MRGPQSIGVFPCSANSTIASRYTNISPGTRGRARTCSAPSQRLKRARKRKTHEGAELKEARERVIELIHKTNQFNLTTRRYNWGELTNLVRGGFGRCYRLTDRFGDNGIISVAAVARDSADDARIDLWLMSCRVLGRKVEETILADLATRARALGARRLIGEYIASPKNALVRDLYPRLGFSEIGNEGATIRYALSLADTPATSATELIAMAEGPPPSAAIAG